MVEKDNVVFIGQKTAMNYVMACLLAVQLGFKEITLKARGKAISRAVDVAEILRNRFLKNKLRVDRLITGTEVLERQDRGKFNVSTIDIILTIQGEVPTQFGVQVIAPTTTPHLDEEFTTPDAPNLFIEDFKTYMKQNTFAERVKDQEKFESNVQDIMNRIINTLSEFTRHENSKKLSIEIDEIKNSINEVFDKDEISFEELDEIKNFTPSQAETFIRLYTPLTSEA